MTPCPTAAELAAKILTYLGFAQAVSMEPGTDGRRDHIQSLIADVLTKLRAPVADDLIHRLRCTYAMGPMIDGEPEFGWRDCSGPAPEGMRLPSPIMLEAAAAIERLATQLRECADTLGADQIDEQRAMRAYADAKALLSEMTHL